MCALQNKWGYSECHKMGNLWPVSAISQTKGVRWVGIKTLTVLFTLKKQQGVPADEQRHWERVIKEKQSLMFLLLKFLLILLCSPYMVLRNRAAAFFWGGWCGVAAWAVLQQEFTICFLPGSCTLQWIQVLPQKCWHLGEILGISLQGHPTCVTIFIGLMGEKVPLKNIDSL